MFERVVRNIRKRGQRTTVEPLPLTFAVDRTEENKHVVYVYFNVDGDEEPVIDVAPLLRYGYQLERQTEDGRKIYVISEEDRQILLALKSLNPTLGAEGALVFDFAPRIFNFVRNRQNVVESRQSRRLQVSDKPLRPRARVSYERGRGITVEAGYGAPESEELVTRTALPAFTHDDYALIEDTFYRLPPSLEAGSEGGSKLLEQAKKQIDLNEVPRFLSNELPAIRADFDVQLDDAAQRLRLRHDPMKLVSRVDFDRARGTGVRIGYRLNEADEPRPRSDWTHTPDGQYAIVDDQFVPFPPVSREVAELTGPSGQLTLDQTPHFFREQLPKLRQAGSVELSERAARVRVGKEPLQPKAIIDFAPDSGLQITAGYQIPGDTTLRPPGQVPRTPNGEYAMIGDTFQPLRRAVTIAGQRLLEAGYQQVPLQAVPEFFARDLVLLRKDFQAVLTDLASQIRIIDEPARPRVRVDRKDRGWLSFNVGYEVAGIGVPHSLFAGQEEYVQVDDKTWVRRDDRALRRVEIELATLGAEANEEGFQVVTAQFASLEAFIEAIGGQAELSASYQAFLAQLKGFKPDPEHRLPPATEELLRKLSFQLRPYQRSGIHWLSWLYGNGLHGILADDMGLGKTLQTVLTLRRAYEQEMTRQHSLILCPKSVMHHWEKEIARFYPSARVERYHGPERRWQRKRLESSFQPIIFISTYATAGNDAEFLATVPFFYLVLDEATYIKNPGSKRSKAAKALNAEHRLALSGTPVENRPLELWSVFDFLMRNHLGTRAQFEQHFEEPITAGSQKATEQLAARVGPFLLRRKKKDVASDLPEKIEISEWCELTAEQRQLYGALQGQAQQIRRSLERGERVNYTTSILPLLTKLKQICDHPAIVGMKPEPIDGRSQKYDWIVEKIEEISKTGDKVVVFSHYLGMLDLLEAGLRRRRFTYVRLDGSTNRRDVVIERFNRGEAQVALLSLMAAGHGITLTAANHVIHADRWWNPAVEAQATDRVHRIGQEKTVYVYRILVEGTLEERIDELLEEKQDLSDRIVDTASQGPREWSRDELIHILQPLDYRGGR